MTGLSVNGEKLFDRLLLDSVQFSSVAQSRPTLCDPMNHSAPGLPVHHQLPEFTQTHVHRVGDAIQPSHPLSFPFSCPQSLPASESFPMSQLFAWGGQSTGGSALASFLPNRAALMHGSWAYWPILQIFDFAVIITWAIPYDKYVSLCFCLSFHISVSPSPSSPLHMCIWKPLTNTDSYLSE